MLAENLTPGTVLDLEDVEYYVTDTDKLFAEYQLAVVDMVDPMANGVFVHFEEHTTLFVPYGYTFTVAE